MYKDLLIENPLITGMMFISFIVIFLILGVLVGNVTALKILTRLGVPVMSGKVERDYRVQKSINKDVIGFINIPDTCYNPIMLCKNGLYKNHNIKGIENTRGELYLSDGSNSFSLNNIANKSDNGFKDLSVIMGTSSSRRDSLRETKFTFLKKYINTDLKKNYPDISIVDNGKLRFFNLLFAVELGLEDRKEFKFSDRDSFIATLRKNSFFDTGKKAERDVIILNGSTGLDTMLVFLVEKEGVTNV